MYDLNPQRPTFFKAWLTVSSFIVLPGMLLAHYLFLRPWSWTLGIALVVSLILAQRVNQWVADDWRAKGTLETFRRR